jgi:hypothetical protein
MMTQPLVHGIWAIAVCAFLYRHADVQQSVTPCPPGSSLPWPHCYRSKVT